MGGWEGGSQTVLINMASREFVPEKERSVGRWSVQMITSTARFHLHANEVSSDAVLRVNLFLEQSRSGIMLKIEHFTFQVGGLRSGRCWW